MLLCQTTFRNLIQTKKVCMSNWPGWETAFVPADTGDTSHNTIRASDHFRQAAPVWHLLYDVQVLCWHHDCVADMLGCLSQLFEPSPNCLQNQCGKWHVNIWWSVWVWCNCMCSRSCTCCQPNATCNAGCHSNLHDSTWNQPKKDLWNQTNLSAERPTLMYWWTVHMINSV